MLRIVFMLSLAVLSACANLAPVSPVPPTALATVAPTARASASALDLTLAPFEDAALLPPELAHLPLAPGRAYAVLVLLPAPGIVDLSNPRRAHRGLLAFLNPLATYRAGTSLGHLMIGWRCADGQAGLVSKSGDADRRGHRMLRLGWGLDALIASYDDGHLVPLAALSEGQRRAMDAGRARIVAMEVTEGGCQRLRHALAAYLARPVAEQARYSMVPTAGSQLGDGCAGFALCLADRAGATGALTPALMRSVELRDSFIGLGRGTVPGVTPYRTEARAPLPLWRLLLGNWSSGRIVGRVRVLDMELVQWALEAAEARAGYTRPQRLDSDDPAIVAAEAGIARWLDGWRRVTPVRMGRARAVVLHRS